MVSVAIEEALKETRDTYDTYPTPPDRRRLLNEPRRCIPAVSGSRS